MTVVIPWFDLVDGKLTFSFESCTMIFYAEIELVFISNSDGIHSELRKTLLRTHALPQFLVYPDDRK